MTKGLRRLNRILPAEPQSVSAEEDGVVPPSGLFACFYSRQLVDYIHTHTDAASSANRVYFILRSELESLEESARRESVGPKRLIKVKVQRIISYMTVPPSMLKRAPPRFPSNDLPLASNMASPSTLTSDRKEARRQGRKGRIVEAPSSSPSWFACTAYSISFSSGSPPVFVALPIGDESLDCRLRCPSGGPFPASRYDGGRFCRKMHNVTMFSPELL